MFRFGGKFIVNKDKYIVLKGINCTFCVQKQIFHNNEVVYNTRFFKLMNNDKKNLISVKTELNDTIDKANNMFLKQSMTIKEQKEK